MKQAKQTTITREKAHAQTARVNTHERQASTAAVAFTRGEHDLSRLLTAADAAAPVYNAHEGRSLPLGLRTALEARYNADLSAVQLHTDAQAADFAHEHGARAFTSGRDIFFGAGMYQPITGDGQRLIAHEVAHVLQQTAVIDPDGVWHATDQHGSADVQRDELWQAVKNDYQINSQLEEQTTRDDLSAVATELEAVLGATATLTTALGESAGVSAFERRVRAGDFNGRAPRARSLLMDTLKILGRYDTVIYLLTQDGHLQTTYPLVSFRDYFMNSPQHGINWATELIPLIPGLSAIFPSLYLEAIWRYLTRPTATPGGSARIATDTLTYNENYIANIGASIPFMKDNERVWRAHVAVYDLNTSLNTMLTQLEQNAAAVYANPVARRQGTIAPLAHLAETNMNAPFNLLRDLSPQMLELTTAARTYWNRVIGLSAGFLQLSHVAFANALPNIGAPNAAPTITDIPVIQITPAMLTEFANLRANRRYSALAGFVTAVKSSITALMGGTPPTLLDATAYNTQITRALTALTASQRALSEQTESVYRRRDIANPDALNVAQWYGLAQWWTEQLLVTLRAYSLTTDQAFMERWNNLADVRLRHRAMVAKFGFMLGTLTQDQPLIDAMLTIFRGQDVGQSYLAFTGAWVKSEVTLNQLQNDVSGVVAGWGLSTGQIVQLYYLLYNQTFVAAARELLAQYGEGLSPQTYGLVQQALRLTEERLPMPERWIPENYTLIWNENDAGDATRGTLFDLLQAHPRFAELQDIGTHRQDHYIIDYLRPNVPFVWYLPQFHRVIDHLRTIPAINALLTAPATPPGLLQLLSDLHAQAETRADPGDQTRFTDLLGTITHSIDATTTTVIGERNQLIEQGNLRDRRVMQQFAAERLIEYETGNRRGSAADAPNRALDAIARFKSDLEHSIPPDAGAATDAAAQARAAQARQAAQARNALHMHVLILNIAPELMRAFTWTSLTYPMTERRQDLITGFFGYLTDTIAFATRADAESQLASMLHTSENTTTVLAHHRALSDLRTRWLDVIRASQRATGMRTTTDLRGLQRIDLDRVLPIDHAFTIDGIRYRITQIHTPFVFHWSYGENTPAYQPPIVETGIGGSEITAASATPLLTYVNVTTDENAEEVDSASITITSSITNPTTSLNDPNRFLMERLSHAVTMQLYVEGLENLRVITETAVNAGMDLAALVPVLTGPITAVQLLRFMIEEMPTIREEILQAPQEIVERLREFVTPDNRAIMLDHLWEYLLFGGRLPFQDALEARLAGGARTGRPATRPRPAPTGRFGRIIAFVRRIGGRIAEMFLSLKARVLTGMVSARRVIGRIPIVGRLLRALPGLMGVAGALISLAGSGLQRLQDILNPQAAELDAEGNPIPSTSAPQSTADQLSAGLSTAFNELFDGLNGMIAPENILPMDIIYAAILERFLGTLGMRGRALALIIRNTSVTTLLTAQIAEALRNEGLDPNLLWQGAVRDRLQGMLHEAQIEMAGGVNNLLNSLFDGAILITVPNIPPTFETDTTEPLTEAMSDDERDHDLPFNEFQYNPWDKRSPPVEFEGGRELSAAERARYQSGFGHDFAHVRVHDDEDADRLTAFYRARALTSGSHIYLSDDLDGRGAARDQILRHELAHVLQQTGARPLSFLNEPLPVPGTPHRGLQRDPRRERAADNMAQRALGTRDDALEIDYLGGVGLLPAVATTLVTRTLAEMQSDHLADTLEGQVEAQALRGIPHAALRKPGMDVALRAGTRFWGQVHALLVQTTASAGNEHEEPFNLARAEIATWFRNHDLSSRVVRAIAFLSTHERTNGTVELVRNTMATTLKNYVFGDTGVTLDIHHDGTNVTRARVLDLSVGSINGSSAMYLLMRRNTENYRARATPAPPPWGSKWERVRTILTGTGSTDASSIWHAGVGVTPEFRLSNALITELEDKFTSYGELSVGSWDNYIETDNLGGTTGGLRVATHGQLTGAISTTTRDAPGISPSLTHHTLPGSSMDQSARSGRESHHIPQFLLVQYFENLNGTKLSRRTPGVGGSLRFPPGFQGATPISRFDDGAGRRIDFDRLDPTSGRSNGLPAISLAADTHINGRLHINGSSQWGSFDAVSRPNGNPIEIEGTWLQGKIIDEVFYAHVRRLTGISATDGGELMRQLYAPIAPATSAFYKEKVYLAIQATYHWMYTNMRTALETALPLHEPQAFLAHAPAGTPMPSSAFVSRVMAAVDGRNARIMSQWR